MADTSFLDGPFLDHHHRTLARNLDIWAAESLYREIRPLRIYEGTSEVQKLVIARQPLSGSGAH